MKKFCYTALLLFCLFSGSLRAATVSDSEKQLRRDAESLLIEWVDTLLTFG